MSKDHCNTCDMRLRTGEFENCDSCKHDLKYPYAIKDVWGNILYDCETREEAEQTLNLSHPKVFKKKYHTK